MNILCFFYYLFFLIIIKIEMNSTDEEHTPLAIVSL